jgi:hypothetical protein
LTQIDPTLAAVFGALGSIPGGVRVIKGTPAVQTYLANRPPENVSRPYRFPATRTAIPLAAAAEPGLEEDVKGIRTTRATGGAVNLMALSKAAKKHVTRSTEDLLNESDDTVARALEVANKHI